MKPRELKSVIEAPGVSATTIEIETPTAGAPDEPEQFEITIQIGEGTSSLDILAELPHHTDLALLDPGKNPVTPRRLERGPGMTFSFHIPDPRPGTWRFVGRIKEFGKKARIMCLAIAKGAKDTLAKLIPPDKRCALCKFFCAFIPKWLLASQGIVIPTIGDFDLNEALEYLKKAADIFTKGGLAKELADTLGLLETVTKVKALNELVSLISKELGSFLGKKIPDPFHWVAEKVCCMLGACP
jgi:hypothetical protein